MTEDRRHQASNQLEVGIKVVKRNMVCTGSKGGKIHNKFMHLDLTDALVKYKSRQIPPKNNKQMKKIKERPASALVSPQEYAPDSEYPSLQESATNSQTPGRTEGQRDANSSPKPKRKKKALLICSIHINCSTNGVC